MEEGGMAATCRRIEQVKKALGVGHPVHIQGIARTLYTFFFSHGTCACFLGEASDLWAHSSVRNWKGFVDLRWKLHGDRRGHQQVLR